MSLFLLDTDHLSLYQTGHPRVVQNVTRHLSHQIAVSVVTAEEQFLGWQAALRRARDDAQRAKAYLRLALTLESLAQWSVLPPSSSALGIFTGLLRQRLNVGSNDLRIAATALDLNGTVVTRNARDFSRVSGLTLVDWSV